MTANRPVDRSLMALFPHLYSRRGEVSDAIHNRNWPTLALHRGFIRMLGTHWSMVFRLDEQTTAARGVGLNVLHERSIPTDIQSGPKALHEPSMLRVDLRDVWHTSFATQNPTRMSLLAADVSPRFPFTTTPSETVLSMELSTGVVARPFGVFPRNMDFENAKPNQKGSVYHPAVQMVMGELWVRPKPSYLRALREALALGAAEGLDHKDYIVLLPDGFALAGALTPPLGAAPLSGWFKVTTRSGTPEGDPVMRLWTTASRAVPDVWTTAVSRLGDALAAAGDDKSKGRAEWLSIAPDRLLSPQTMFWPCEVTKGILLRRSQDEGALWFDAGLAVAFTSATGNRLSVETGAFRLDGSGERLTVSTRATPEKSDSALGLPVDARYAYTRDAETEELLTLGGRGDPEGDMSEIELAVPMLSNAARVREAMGFEDPSPDPKDRQGRLWLYTPLDGGWLHWPFPNATTALLDPIIKAAPPGSTPPLRNDLSQTAGLWRFRPGKGRRERPWSLALSDARGIDLIATLGKDDKSAWRLESAQANLFDLSLALEHALPVTAFAQSETHLLPESADRALRQTGLSMVTPDLLIGTEAQAWFLQPDNDRLRVKASLPALTLTRIRINGVPEPQLDPAAELTISIDWPQGNAGDAFKAPTGSAQPWLWLRQGTLPSLQTMPLAVTGEAGAVPSSSRELAPFRRINSADRRLDLTFQPAFDTRTSTISLRYDIGNWERPGTGTAWEGELGMTLPTLPSLTLFPGDAESRSCNVDLPPWASGNAATVPTPVDLRHDIALTDEGAALASLPPPPEDLAAKTGDGADQPAVRPASSFALLGYNSPGHETASPEGTSWLPVWADRARAQALTATHARRSIVTDDDGNAFLQVLGDQLYPAEVTVTLSINMVPDSLDLAALGTWSLQGDNLHGLTTPLYGLPATRDLSGLGGTVLRGASSAKIVRSTLSAVRDSDPFTDQSGATTKPAVAKSTGLQYKIVTLARPDRTRKLLLATTPTALEVSGTELRLFVRDIPFEDGTADLSNAWYDSTKGFDAAANALSPDEQHSHAFGWTLAQTGGLPHRIITGPFIFEPLALTRATLAGDALGVLTFKGRINLPLPSESDQPRLVASPSEATLTVDVAGGRWTLEAVGLSLPLADPLIEQGTVPWLEFDRLILSSDDNIDLSGARMRIAVAEKTLKLPLGPATLDDAGLTFARERTQTPPSDNTARFEALHLTLPRPTHSPGGIAVDGITATIGLSTHVVPGPDVSLNLSQGIDPWSLSLSDIAVEDQGGTLRMGELTLEVGLPAITLSGSSLGLDLEGKPNTSILGGLELSTRDVSGSILASLGQATDTEIVIDAVAFALQTTGQAGPNWVSIAYDSTTDDRNVVVRAKIELPNAMSAPKLDVTEEDAVFTATPTDGSGPPHSVSIHVDNARLPLASLSNSALALPARVAHRIGVPDAGRIAWQSFQIVRLSASTDFARNLFDPDRDPPEISFRPALEDRLDTQIRKHVAKSKDAMPSGLSARQIADLPTVFASDRAATIVDFGAHHLITPNAGDAPVLLPLPGIGALRAADHSKAQADLAGFLAPKDIAGLSFRRPVPKPLTRLTDTHRAQLAQAVTWADSRALNRHSDLATTLLGPRPGELDRPLFQGETTYEKDGKMTWSDPAHPWADVAILRHWMLKNVLIGKEEFVPREVLGLRQAGHIDDELVRPDLVTNDNSIFTPAAFAIAWSRLGAGTDHLLPAPPPPRNLPESWSVRLAARDRDEGPIATIARAAMNKGDTGQSRDWARGVLARLAPQAATGLSIHEATKGGVARFTVAEIVKSSRPASERHEPPEPQTTPYPNIAQSQRLEGQPPQLSEEKEGGTGTEKFQTEYLPVKSDAPALRSEPGALPDSGQTEVRLTAAAAEVGFALARSDQRVLYDGTGRWLSDRQVAIPRRSEPVEDTGGRRRITFALPPGTIQPPPPALLPVSAAPPATPDTPLGNEMRGLLPTQSTTRYIGARSGILALSSFGIDSHNADGDPHQSARGLLGQRLPRPLELGVNDRPRASAFEPSHLALASGPQAILHGPARTLDRRDLLAQAGLDRAPRGAFATLIGLTAPDAGIVARDWDGTLTLTPIDTFVYPGQDATAVVPWSISLAVLRIGARTYTTRPPLSNTADDPKKWLLDVPLILRGFRDEAGETATAGLQTVPDAAPITLTLVAENSGLTRLTVMALRKGGPETPLVDTPAFFRFDDPAYNDRLTGLPRLDRIPIEGSANTDIVLLADRKDARPDDFVQTAIVLVPRGDGDSAMDVKFNADGSALVFDNGTDTAPLAVLLERRRPDQAEVVTLHPRHPRGADGKLPDLTLNLRDPANAELPLLLFDYVTGEDLGTPVLAEDDTLTLRITLGAGDTARPLTLDFDITERPRYPVNPSGYGVLRMDGPERQPREVSAPLYARGAVPDVLELVDPAEMIVGTVRRRAIYYWSSFERRGGGGVPRFALLKSNASGSSWLAADTRLEWLPLAKLATPEDQDET